MKKLTRMKLINWHRFINCTIDFGSSTLISGENGAGKSTLLDAIQFVVTCSANAFNKAAHENGKRKLTGYIRCKTGRENKPYERTGQLSAHIALEFYEESKKRYFIIGAVVDSASEGQETTVRYLIDNQKLSDEMFLHDRHIRSINEFRAANKGIKQWCKTQSEAKKMVQGKLGRIEDKFFRLIPKALAFKPIDDIKDFVYSYVLDEKEVNIDILRENVRTYQDLERTLESVKKRMSKLEQIEKHHDEVLSCKKKDQMYEFFLQQAQLDITKETMQELQSQIRSEEYRLQQIQDSLEQISAECKNKREMETNLRVELKQNKDFLALEEQEKEKERLESEVQSCRNDKNELMRSVRKAVDNAKKLLGVSDADPCIRRYSEALKQIEHCQDIAEIKELTSKVIEYETQTTQKSYEQFRDNFDRRRKANETICKNAEKQMIHVMIVYKTEHDFGAAPSMEGYPEYASVYERLRTSELLEYEEKVQSARVSAEEEFREQFLAKLQENMKQAQSEFRELNKALKDITFSNERYEFIYMPSGHYRNYYDMIMDDFNVIQGESIFSGIFHETHKEVIDELFERLALNNESSSKTLAEFTDYRTYMDYDIKIIHSDGTFSYYSKVCEEKSGGETQTPFYVTVAASFVQLYTNNIGGEATGLVMFDEAFNNMDDERISGVLEFMNRLPLQLIIAAPPDKIQYIGPSMEETLLIMTDEKVSFVEKYCHEI